LKLEGLLKFASNAIEVSTRAKNNDT
jgi:hypothetical protein